MAVDKIGNKRIVKKGIDVSKWNGNINWGKVKAAGIDFAIIRAGHGQSTIDAYFRKNADACKRLGIPFGVYWFSYALNAEMARNEARACLAAIKGYNLEYPVFFDYEYDSVTYSVKKGVTPTKSSVSIITDTFCLEIERSGYRTGIYTNLDFHKRYLDAALWSNNDMWAARYTTTPVDIADKAELWQYSSSGKVNGISGAVDLDYASVDYPSIITKTQKTDNKQISVNVDDVKLSPSKTTYKIPDMYKIVFDPVFYLNNYSDLRAAVNQWIRDGIIPNDEKTVHERLFEHFQIYGMKEARVANTDFDVNKYREANPDLENAYRNDWTAYYVHYMTCGYNEIRDGRRRDFR